MRRPPRGPVAGHATTIHRERGIPNTFQARCSCGWSWSRRGYRETAQDDCGSHLARVTQQHPGGAA